FFREQFADLRLVFIGSGRPSGLEYPLVDGAQFPVLLRLLNPLEIAMHNLIRILPPEQGIGGSGEERFRLARSGIRLWVSDALSGRRVEKQIHRLSPVAIGSVLVWSAVMNQLRQRLQTLHLPILLPRMRRQWNQQAHANSDQPCPCLAPTTAVGIVLNGTA